VASAPDPARVRAPSFRHVLGHFATGVTVVAGTVEGQPRGLAVNSFTSASLDPPLVTFCVDRRSSTWEGMAGVDAFCVSVLAEDQEALCRTFATHGVDRFAGVGWRPAPSGAPILGGCLAWVDCSIEATHRAGDHHLVLGMVHALGVEREVGPLVFYRGGYGRFQP